MFNKFCHTIVIPGTLAAAAQYVVTMPSPCTLQHISMVQSNAGSARIRLGTSSDDDAYLAYTDLGVSGTPVEIEAAGDFVDDVRPHLADGDILKLTLDHDGDGGTAAQNVTIVLTFTEG